MKESIINTPERKDFVQKLREFITKLEARHFSTQPGMFQVFINEDGKKRYGYDIVIHLLQEAQSETIEGVDEFAADYWNA